MKFIYEITDNYQMIKDFLQKQKYSQKLIRAIKQKGKVLVNGKDKKLNDKILIGDTLEVVHPEEKIAMHYPFSKQAVKVIYEDDYLLVVSKPPHLETIPSIRNNDDTLANRLKYYFIKNNIRSNLHFVTRLDKETSGLVLIAKSRYLHHLLSNHVKINKKYLAKVSGILPKDIIIEKKIKRINEKEMQRMVDSQGKYAKTFVKVLQYINDNTLVECEIFTGRTHQIRVHLNYLGHPIIGDSLYGGKQDKRLNLHCFMLCFEHPIFHKRLVIKDYEGEFYERNVEEDLSR